MLIHYLMNVRAQYLKFLILIEEHLLPVYKKPMIYYPLETLLKAGIKDILIVTGGEHVGDFFQLLGSGKEWGAHFSLSLIHI